MAHRLTYFDRGRRFEQTFATEAEALEALEQIDPDLDPEVSAVEAPWGLEKIEAPREEGSR
jgi:hypothetical protein